MPQYRKTRRHLKSHRNRKTRRARRAKQRGGAVTSAEEWVTKAQSKFNSFGDNKKIVFGALKDDDLTLLPPSDAERDESVSRKLPMEIDIMGYDKKSNTYTQRPADIRDMALNIRTKFKDIFATDNLEQVTTDDFITAINALSKLNVTSNRLATDDLMLNSLNYFQACENGLIALTDRERYVTTAPADMLIQAAEAGPLFIWALAMNISGDAAAVSLFPNADQAIETSELPPP